MNLVWNDKGTTFELLSCQSRVARQILSNLRVRFFKKIQDWILKSEKGLRDPSSLIAHTRNAALQKKCSLSEFLNGYVHGNAHNSLMNACLAGRFGLEVPMANKSVFSMLILDHSVAS